MTSPLKTLAKVLRGSSDANVRFNDLRRMLRAMRFDERIRGGHYIHTRSGIIEIINLQPRGSLAKPYQVK